MISTLFQAIADGLARDAAIAAGAPAYALPTPAYAEPAHHFLAQEPERIADPEAWADHGRGR